MWTNLSKSGLMQLEKKLQKLQNVAKVKNLERAVGGRVNADIQAGCAHHINLKSDHQINDKSFLNKHV